MTQFVEGREVLVGVGPKAKFASLKPVSIPSLAEFNIQEIITIVFIAVADCHDRVRVYYYLRWKFVKFLIFCLPYKLDFHTNI